MDLELEHQDTFDALFNDCKLRPSILDPLWSAFGFVLEATTAAMEPKAAMPCAIAVEEIIGEHYAHQVEHLRAENKERELTHTLERFGDEELESRDIASKHDGRDATGYPVLQRVIQSGCRAAFNIAEKLKFPEDRVTQHQDGH